MISVELKKINHNFSAGQECPNVVPNVKDDCILTENGIPVGFFIKKLDGKISKCADFCNSELLSSRVPKSLMVRSDALRGDGVKQYSTIIGSVPPKPQMRRPYPSISSVHSVKSASDFIKGMIMLARLSNEIIKEIMPEQYEKQKKLIKENVLDKYVFGDLFTSSISNFNISAKFHTDRLNIKETVNVIITKRKFCNGGNLYVPDYDACFDQDDNSMLVYPAWRNLHGVTPIDAIGDGYRNSLVFYPLSAFGKDIR
jgi:hypothetical protein